MRYVIAKETIGLVAQAHKLITGKTAEFEPCIQVEDPRMVSIIEALGGFDVTVVPSATIIIKRAPDETAASVPATKSEKLCQICQKPVAGPRAKICNDPACKKEVQRRYNQKYLQRKRTEEEPDQDAPLSESRDLPEPAFGMTHVISEMADARSA